MMKRILFLGFLSLSISCSKENSIVIPTNSTGEVASIKTYGGSKNDAVHAVVNTNDGGYAVAGYSQSIDHDITDKSSENFDFWLLKFSSEDMLEWSKTFGGTKDDRANDIMATSDGGFAILGYANSADGDASTNAGAQDFWLIKLDASGNLIWQKSFGYAGNDYGNTLIETNDNGYLITGVLDVSASGGEGNSRIVQRHAGGDIWALKLDAMGNTEWTRYYGGSFTDTAYGIAKTVDNGYVIVGSSDSDDVDIANNKGTYDFWVLKIASTGEVLWEKSFGGTEIDEARAIIPSNDGSFIIVGDTRSSDTDVSSNNGAADLWMLKISSEGTLIWEKSFGGTSFDVARSITKTQDNGFLIAGSSRSSDGDVTTNQGQNDAWILKVDANGALEWQRTLGGSQIDFVYDAVQLSNGAVIAVGESSSTDGDILENKGFTDALIVKLK